MRLRQRQPRFIAFISAALAAGHVVAFLGILWCLWLGALAMGEKVPAGDGLGWDGSRFAKMTQAGPSMLLGKEINSYYVQRIGPSFAVRGILTMVGAPLDGPAVRAGFIVLNMALLSFALVLLMDAGVRLGLGAPGRWILFLGLFVNAPNARLPIYYAPIGDSTAFFLGSLIVWAYVARHLGVAVLALGIAIVSWPAAFLLLPLLLWPRSNAGLQEIPAARQETAVVSPWALAASVPGGAALLGLLWVAVDMPGFDALTREMALSLGANAMYLGLAAAVACAVAGSHLPLVLARPAWRGVASVVALIGISAIYVRTFESGSLAFSGLTYGREILLFARTRALGEVFGHAAYYGALATCAIILWPSVLRESLRFGAGAFLATVVAGLLSFDAESRRLNAEWPLVGLLAALVVERVCRDRSDLIAFAAAALALSKLWWRFSGPDLFMAAHEPGNYYNLQGPSMSLEAAAAHGIAVALVALWIVRIRRSPGHPHESA